MTGLLLLAMAVVAAAAPLALARAGRLSPFHPAFAFGVPYLLITAGPAVRYLLWGIPPYGVHLEMLDPALGVALSAQLGITVGCLVHLRFGRAPAGHLALGRPRRFRTYVLAVCLVVLAVDALALSNRWETLAVLGKADLGGILSLWQRSHYAGLLLLLGLMPALITVDQTLERRPLPRASAVVLGLFALVCLLSGERDVALATVMVPISWFAVRREMRPVRRRRRLRVVIQGVGAFAVAAVLLALLEWARSGEGLGLAAQVAALGARSREQSIVQAVLGLGSNLFIVSRVVEWVPAEVPYERGLTYVHTLANLLPSFVLPDARFESLLTWFKMRYAPTSDSGYGFGMEAEAYLNFGLVGPVLVFAAWTFWLCRLHQGHALLPGPTLYRAAYTFLLPFSLYAIRGDSVMLVKGFGYSAILVWTLARLAGVRRLRRIRTVRPAPVARPARLPPSRPALVPGTAA